ncbi:MAG: T9SS type A sorting domain-containing protein [Ignavibacteriales bacterium]|nr:T9SS type A sorting domain-containing protein [Ignavibacteriales bacterium]
MLGQSVDIATLMNSTSTYDQNAHIIYQDDGIYHKSAANWNTSDLVSTDFLYYSSIGFSSAGNDLFATWKPQGSGYIKYRQYDAAPLTPTNFTGTSYNNHPKLTWSLINGPDVVYEIHRKVSPFGEPAGTWQLLTSVSSATGSYVDNGFEITGQQREGTVEYKVRAKDLQPIYSAFTGVVSYSYYGVNKINFGSVKEFSLSQNYPNPFNPSTVIKFSIPEKSFVTLKVYDMLGREVAELVNEELETGNFEKTFDAGSLSSGIYIYRISAMKDGKILFNESKQMLLIK